MKIKRSNLQSFCRTCLDQLHSADASSNFIISETPNLTKLLIICTTLNLNEDEDYIYPQSLCKKCYDMLQQFRDFRDMALQSAEVLRKIVSDTSEDVSTTTSNTLFNDDNYAINPDAQNYNEPEYKIEFEITHLQENYIPESSFLDSDSSTPIASTAKKRKLTDDADEKFQCEIGGCCFNLKSKKALEEHIKLEHTTDSPYNNYEIFDVTYEEELNAMVKKRPKTAAERSREYRERKKYMIKKPPARTSSERSKECRERQKAEKPSFEIAHSIFDVVCEEQTITSVKKRAKTAAERARAYRERKKASQLYQNNQYLATNTSVLLKQDVSLVKDDVNLTQHEIQPINDISNWLEPATIKKKIN